MQLTTGRHLQVGVGASMWEHGARREMNTCPGGDHARLPIKSQTKRGAETLVRSLTLAHAGKGVDNRCGQ